MIKLIDLFGQLSVLGAQHTSSMQERRQLILVNQICLIISLCSLAYIFIFLLMGFTFLGLLAFVVVICYGGCITLNYKGAVQSAKWGLLSTTTIAVTFYASSLGKESGLQLLLLALTAVPLVIFNFKDKTMICLGSLVPIFGILVLECSHYSWGYRYHFNSLYAQIMNAASWVIIILINFMYIQFYFKEFSNAEESLEITIQELNQSNRQLLAAYEELESIQKEHIKLMKNQPPLA